MIIKCAWCGAELGDRKPAENPHETHDICPECLRHYTRQLDRAPPRPQPSWRRWLRALLPPFRENAAAGRR
jgi:hypothetical protein